ncbi:MAG: hypothetical protein DRN30_03190 [Thermoplasmata archaeon]|nr:MAG: hypothetical protein DRN30_03190 [Thermoplasmata archaeon]
MELYTAQYRYDGMDRIDITVKGQAVMGRHFAPTWDMVLGYKHKPNEYSQKLYTYEYLKMLANKQASTERYAFDWLVSRETVTVVCFCVAGTFCHRYLLKDFLLFCYPDRVTYMGERT